MLDSRLCISTDTAAAALGGVQHNTASHLPTPCVYAAQPLVLSSTTTAVLCPNC
jgi:hypothetical protein